MPGINTCAGKMYRTRDPEASPFFALVRDYFDEFEQVYPQRSQKQYGFWRSVIRDSIDKFLKCGDLKEGLARVRCPDCGTEFFVAFSCRQRCCYPSYDQKRSLLFHEIGNGIASCASSKRQTLRFAFFYNRTGISYFAFDHDDIETEQYKPQMADDTSISFDAHHQHKR